MGTLLQNITLTTQSVCVFAQLLNNYKKKCGFFNLCILLAFSTKCLQYFSSSPNISKHTVKMNKF